MSGRTYGTLKLNKSGDSWLLKCEPHVAMWAKRIFKRLPKSSSDGAFKLSNNPSTCRDLEWFVQRFPLDIADQDELTGQSNKHRDHIARLDQIIDANYKPRVFSLAIEAREYQRRGAELFLAKGSLLLADDVGLGKTATSIAALTDPSTLPALVVCLAHLPKQWEREINKFAPDLHTHILKKGTPYELPRFMGRGQDVLISSYHKLSGWQAVLSSYVKTIIIDECQELRRTDSNKYCAAKKIADSCTYRIGLSATPVYNFGGEIYSVLNVLSPGSLGTFSEFHTEWCTGFSDKLKLKDPAAFGSWAKEQHLMLRRTRKDVGRELPPLSRITHTVDCDSSALKAVEGKAGELARLILSEVKQERGTQMHAAEEFNNVLRQATGIAKAPYVAEFVRLLIENGEPVVLFGWHRSVYEIWLEKLKDFKPVLYTGSESATAKQEAMWQFCAKKTDLLIMSLRSGAGVDGLQNRCRTPVFGELDWSPGVHEQCLSADTEILTRDGFKGIDDVSIGDKVAGFDIGDGSIRWVPATHKTDRLLANEEMFATETERIDIRVTGRHRMVSRRKTRTTSGVARSKWSIETAESLAGQARRYVPTNGVERASGVPLSDYELRLIGWFMTDGYFSGRKNLSMTICQAAHQPWNEDIKDVLNGCGLRWTFCQRLGDSELPGGYMRTEPTLMNLYTVASGRNSHWSKAEINRLKEMESAGMSRGAMADILKRSNVAIYKKLRKIRNNTLESPIHETETRGWEYLREYLVKDVSPLLENATSQQIRSLLHGIFMGDGFKHSKNVRRICSKNKRMMDRLQSLCVRRGMSATLRETCPGVFHIAISDDREASIPRGDKKNGFASVEAFPDERVWCVTNELGTLITRRNGKVAIVGNCIGRMFRDGQPDPVTAYFLISESGADPLMAEVLGLKRDQIEGIRGRDDNEIVQRDESASSIRKLAEQYLKRAPQKVEVASA